MPHIYTITCNLILFWNPLLSSDVDWISDVYSNIVTNQVPVETIQIIF